MESIQKEGLLKLLKMFSTLNREVLMSLSDQNYGDARLSALELKKLLIDTKKEIVED